MAPLGKKRNRRGKASRQAKKKKAQATSLVENNENIGGAATVEAGEPVGMNSESPESDNSWIHVEESKIQPSNSAEIGVDTATTSCDATPSETAKDSGREARTPGGGGEAEIYCATEEVEEVEEEVDISVEADIDERMHLLFGKKNHGK